MNNESTVIADIESNIANELFLQHNQVLQNGYVDDLYIGITIDNAWTGGSWRHSRRTNRISVKVNTMDRPVTFRQLKKGGHNYKGIADKLHDLYNIKVASKKREDEKLKVVLTNKAIRDQIVEDYELSTYTSNLSVNNYGNLVFKVSGISEELARELVEVAQKHGHKMNY